MPTTAQIRYQQRTGRFGHRRLLVLWLPLLVLPIQGCGGDGDEVAAPPTRPLPRGYMTQPVMPMQGQMPMPQRQMTPPGGTWSQWPQGQTQQTPAAGPAYPQARNPWQGPPVGFGREPAQGQLVWPQQQPRPELPQFRPWEEEHAQEQARGTSPLVAPYDRPFGSSRRGGQPMLPGGYQPGLAPGYAPGYGYYPPAGTGYWGMPGPWGTGMPGMWSGW
jgi:hypothetical protein